MNLIDILDYEEGYRNKPYLCSEGFLTWGYGTKISNIKGLDPKDFPIQLNRNIAMQLMLADTAEMEMKLNESDRSATFNRLDEDRRAIILSMSYQMGVSGVLNFNNMWNALEVRDWEEAGKEALDSVWARQTPGRAGRHARVLAGESLEYVYGEVR